MRRIIITSLTLIAAALLVVPASAVAQTRSRTPAPQITRVQPMRVAVGGTLTISGRHFKAAASQEHSDLPARATVAPHSPSPAARASASSWCAFRSRSRAS